MKTLHFTYHGAIIIKKGDKRMEKEEIYLYKSDEELYVNQVIYDPIKFTKWINETSLQLGATTEDVKDNDIEYFCAKQRGLRMEQITQRSYHNESRRNRLGLFKDNIIPGTFRIYHNEPLIIKKLLATYYRQKHVAMFGIYYSMECNFFDNFCFYHLYEFLYCNDHLYHSDYLEYLEIVKEYLKQFEFIETQKKVMRKNDESKFEHARFGFQRNVAKANQKILSLHEMN